MSDPCEKYACPHADRCRKELLACNEFARFVITGIIRPLKQTPTPTKEKYLEIYPDDKKPT